MRIGVLALQGAVQEHERALRRLGAEVVQVRLPVDLDGVSGLVLPGGESTVMARYLDEYGLGRAIRDRAAAGMALFGVCAGAILLCEEVDGRPGALGLLPAKATRNAYGRQLASFEETIDSPVGRFAGLFIRAPRLEALGATETLARRATERGGEAVLLRYGGVLAASFHPELSGDDRLHEYFLRLAAA
ncbi:MAG: pyridoxal 5'-phosphate synthase glutaminase subunit PdxT [Spirochaetae bacterium HGW-Spirochaetae-3]|jgi:5'-phosphate synthase pdxT subunit|nr:MAG: pyridoxal 5'-phosphate synthase glutaminase subunit PdxT [Spirochaetae bacterium HGW-Spirochaetae-3]